LSIRALQDTWNLIKMSKRVINVQHSIARAGVVFGFDAVWFHRSIPTFRRNILMNSLCNVYLYQLLRFFVVDGRIVVNKPVLEMEI
jgi:hypothetical protein